MKRPGPGVVKELLPLVLILASLAGTLGLVVSMHRHVLSTRRRPQAPVAALPPVVETKPKPLPPPPQIVQPPPPPPPVVPQVDPTIAVLAQLSAQEAAEVRAAKEADRRAEALEAARKSALAESERWRRRESLVHAQVARLSRQSFEAEQQVEELTLERDALARERDASKAALTKAVSRGGGYAVLPNKGANGTWQRPVVIECRNGLAILQPHNLSYTMLDLSPLLGVRSSPFVAAVGRELLRVQQVTSPDGAPVVPYIYFIVRPDGIRPYYEARARLEPLGIAFGYELVDQDWEIDFPDIDTWDESAVNRPKAGASGGGDFVWPSERPGGDRPGGTDPALWPRSAPGALAGDGGNAPDETGGTGQGLRPGPGSTGGFRPGGSGAGEPRPGPGSLGGLDLDALAREALGVGGFGPGRATQGGDGPDLTSIPRSALNQPVPLPTGRGHDPRREAGGSPTAAQPGLNQIGPGGLPGFDRAEGRGDTAMPGMPRGGTANPSSTTGNGSTRAGAPATNPPGGSPGTPVDLKAWAPTAPGRVRLDPSMLAQAEDSEDRPPLPPTGLRPGGASGSSGAGLPPSSGDGPGGAGSPPAGTSVGTGSPGDRSGAKGAKSTRSAAPAGRLEVDVPLDLVIACGPNGVVLHPGGYRLSLATLRREKRLKGDLETIVRNHELIDPTIHPRPNIRFLVEPGGSETYWEARRQTVLSGLSWPVSTQVAESSLPRVFEKERF